MLSSRRFLRSRLTCLHGSFSTIHGISNRLSRKSLPRNTVAAGYVGKDDTVIKHVRIGNSGIVFPDKYPFVQVGGGTAIAPGVMGTFAGKTWNADAIVRYDTAAMKNLTLSGMNEVTDTLIPITSPVRGKWFVLPDAPVTGSVSVFVEDDTGTHVDTRGRKWRELGMSEFRVSGITGIIELDTAASASVAVVYGGSYALSSTQAGTSLINFVKDTRDYFVSTTGNALIDDYLRNANDFIANIDGQNALLVRERGYISPFEALFRYAASGSDLDAVYQDSGMIPEWFTVDAYNESYAEITVLKCLWRNGIYQDSRSPAFRSHAHFLFCIIPHSAEEKSKPTSPSDQETILPFQRSHWAMRSLQEQFKLHETE